MPTFFFISFFTIFFINRLIILSTGQEVTCYLNPQWLIGRLLASYVKLKLYYQAYCLLLIQRKKTAYRMSCPIPISYPFTAWPKIVNHVLGDKLATSAVPVSSLSFHGCHQIRVLEIDLEFSGTVISGIIPGSAVITPSPSGREQMQSVLGNKEHSRECGRWSFGRHAHVAMRLMTCWHSNRGHFAAWLMTLSNLQCSRWSAGEQWVEQFQKMFF